MKNIKLLLASPSFYPFYGGAEIRFRRYLPFFLQHGVTPSVITGTPKEKKITNNHRNEAWYSADFGEKLPDESFRGIKIERYRLPGKPAKKRLEFFHREIRNKILSSESSPDVIQFLSPFHPSAVETFKLASKHNIKTIVAYTLAKKPHANILKEWLRKKSMKRLYSAPDCIVVSSIEVKSYLWDLGVRNKIEVIANGVDSKLFCPIYEDKEKTKLRKSLGIEVGKKILLHVGTIHPRKGTDLLLGAFKLIAKKHNNIDLYIIGSDVNKHSHESKHFYEIINKYLADPLLKGRVHLLGVIDNVEEYMQVSDVFVFPSREEGMGNVVMEAMATNLPVVTTPYLGFPAIFGQDKKHFLHADFTCTSIAENIEKVLHENSLRASLISHSYENVLKKLQLSDSVRKYAELYRGHG